MIWPPPGGVPAHSENTSVRQIRKTTRRFCGGMNARGRSGAAAGVSDAAGAAVAAPAGALPPTATIALRHVCESFAELLCKHSSAAGPPGWTPEQFAMKSDRQAERIAAV